MTRLSPSTFLLALGLALLGCGPSAVNPIQPGPAAPAPPAAPKTLTFAVPDEPGPLISTIGGSSRRVAEDIANAVHQHLANYDDTGRVHPMLASELPSTERGTWTVRPDGTMQTTYPLRRDVTWHDGTPFTAKDVVFAWAVTRDPSAGMADRVVADLISGITTPDDFTLVIEWAKTYPFANAIVEEDLGPYPVHLLESLYQTDHERFRNANYWTTQFVGLGPYRLAEWELGSHLTLQKYDRFHAGPAKIDTIVVRFLGDEATIVANLLAGTVDGVNPNGITFNEALLVKSEWEKAGTKPVGIVQTTHWRIMGTQFRVPNPREITDVRIRRGLLHALDRKAMVDHQFRGLAPLSDTFVPQEDPKWDWVKDVVTRYEYDPARAQQLLAEGGWTRGSDGALADASGRRVSIPVWSSSRRTEDELALIGDYWKQVGADVQQIILTSAQNNDREYQANFPAFFTDQASIIFRNLMNKTYSGNCPTAATRWIGGNGGCYSNPAVDRAVDALTIATQQGDQQRLYRELVKLQTEELPILPLYFLVRMSLFRDGVTGVKGDTNPRTGLMWNVAEWDMR